MRRVTMDKVKDILDLPDGSSAAEQCWFILMTPGRSFVERVKRAVQVAEQNDFRLPFLLHRLVKEKEKMIIGYWGCFMGVVSILALCAFVLIGVFGERLIS